MQNILIFAAGMVATLIIEAVAMLLGMVRIMAEILREEDFG